VTFSRSATGKESAQGAGSFRHEALLYGGADEFVESSRRFVEEGLAGEEAVMVATTPVNLRGLKDALGSDADQVLLVDMTEVGRNPGRIISVWRQFLDRARAAGRSARGIGEPVWAGRSPDELDECERHEALINSAFDGASDFWLVCPYDVAKLPAEVLAAAEATHPHVHDADGSWVSKGFDAHLGSRALSGALTPPPRNAPRLPFDARGLPTIRKRVREAAGRAGLSSERADDFVFAVNEVAANAIRHGDGTGTVTLWSEPPRLVCELGDSGRIEDPLVGRTKPTAEQLAGRGMWIVHELCDLVQVRSSASGNTIRLTQRVDD
jgi:anti-sigma regulatory factor (Ser/Thr protein kinase)